MAHNFYKIIRSLILMKAELGRVKKPKFSSLIATLQAYEFKPDCDDNGIPDASQLAAVLNYSKPKTNLLLRQLLDELVLDFRCRPLEIRDYIHRIHIHIPYDERKKYTSGRKQVPNEWQTAYTWLDVKLPITPKIGEVINLDFLQDVHYAWGTVYNVRHTIDGYTQEIYIEVHPLKDEYYRWQKLKENYENDISRQRFIEKGLEND
jgi:hypothetical protein